MKKTNKILAIILAILIVVSTVPITASAEKITGTCGENLTWSFDESTGTLTISGEGAMDDYGYDNRPWKDFKDEIENVVINDGVTSIGECAFDDCANLKNVTIPGSVTTIGGYAFDDCNSLTKVVLPEGVTKIGDYAFANCDYLDTVVIPGTVTDMGDSVFASCDRLANVTLCDGMTDLGLRTFSGCISLTDIVIPESITSLRGANFEGCINLKSITFSLNIEAVGYGTFGDCVNLQDVYYTGTEEDLLEFESIPFGNNEPLFAANFHCESTIHRHNYVESGEYVAEFCDEDGYTTYSCECGHSYKGDYVKATEHNYNDGVVTTNPTCTVDGIKTFTCSACGGTRTEPVPQTGHSYDDGVITTAPNCVANGVKTFTCEACGDKYTEAIDKTGEHNYQLVPNTKPDSGCVKTYKCSGCGDTYQESVGTTHNQFKTPEFAPTETKNGLTVGISCSECGAVILKQEVIPALGTTDDSSVIVSGTCGTSATWTFNKNTGALIISGTGAISNYKSVQVRPWEDYEDDIKSIIINDGITKIGNYAFDNFGSLIYVSIPDSVTSIGSNVFRWCSKLRSIEIPDSVDTINYSTFEGCEKLAYIKLSNRINYIQDTLFKGCVSLTHVTVPDSVYYINGSSFLNCTNLKSVTIGKNVTNIYNYAFSGCTALAEVYYTGTEEQWNKIIIDTGNDPLLMATNRYDGTGGDILTGHQNHKNTVTTIEPTCTEAGYTKFVCECGYEYTVDYDALGHTLEEIPVILPTSSRVGYTRGEKCATCNMVTAEPVMVPIIGESARAGDAGGTIIWVYNEATQTMEFYGKGYLKYYDPIQDSSNDSDDRPWAIYGYSKVQYVIVHEGIQGIASRNFYYFTGLKMISLPSSLNRIANLAFEGCEDFYVKYNGTREDWDKIDGHLTNYDRIIFNDYNGVTASGTHGDNLTWTYDGLTCTLTILGIGPMESVAYNEYPWYEYISEIDTIVIKEGVTTIGDGAFRGYDNCKSITIPSSVIKIGDYAFYPDNIFKYKPKDVYYLGTEEMWNNISMGSLNILLDDNYATIHFVKYAGYCGNNITYTFDGSTLILTGTGDMCEFEVDWSGEVYSPWANWALEIEHIVIGDGITSISDDAFSSCGTKLQTVTFGSDVKKIGAYAFYWCKSLTEIVFPDGLTVIGKYAFYNSTSIKTIVLPDSIEEIEKGAFCDCTGITDVHYQGTESQWDEIIINSENNELINATIHYNSKEVHGHSFDSVVTPPTCTEGGYTTYTCPCGDTYVDDYVYKTGHTDNDNNEYCEVCNVYIYTATGVCGDNLTWTFNESTDTLTVSGTGDMYDFEPNTAPWQDYKPSIKKVIICDGVTSIGERAFSACKNLESVTIGNDVTGIGSFAFNSCENLKTVVLGNSVEIIGEQAFFYCESLTSIIIPDSVTRIGDYAFEHCESLETVTIGSGVEKVGHDAFYLCKKLKDVYYNGSAVDWQNIYFLFGMDSFLANATIHYLKEGHSHDYETVVTAPTCTEQGYTTYTCECGDTYVGDYVATLAHLDNDNNGYCDDCSIATGSCGDNLTWVFDEETGVLTISGTGNMDDFTHNKRPWESYEDNIKKIVINDGVTSIGKYAFAYFDNLQDVTISDSVLSISENAFCDCDSLTEIVIPENVKTILSGAFVGCDSLMAITVDSDNKYYSNDEYGVLYNKDKTVLLQYPFGNTQKDYIIPDGVRTICYMAFNYSSNLESVTIPESVTTLEDYVFINLYYDLKLNYKGTQAQWEELLANNSETSEYLKNYIVTCSDTTVYPSGSCGDNLTWTFNQKTGILTISGTGAMYDYEIDDVSGFINQPWYDFSRDIKHIVIEDGVTSIGEAAFANCDVVDITIGKDVATIGNEAIKYCDYLTEIIVDEDNQYYSNDEFGVLFNKDKTTLIHYPIGNQRESYTIPDGVKVIGAYAFDKCNTTLLKVTIPKSVTTIEKFAFTATGFLKNYKVDYVGTKSEWNLVSVDGTNDIAVTCLESDHQHKYESVVTEPTCTEQGYTTYTCECGDTYVADYVDATGHHHKPEVTIPATHLEEGLMTFICACGDTYTGIIEKLEKHNYETVVTAPTCTEQGYTTYTCECGDTYVADYVDALGHTEETIPAVAPTCTETGLTEGAKCSVCGEMLTEQKELPANGHTPANAIEENYIASTCTENGSKDIVTYCSVCEEEISRETVVINATGHIYTTVVTAPTCTEQGYTTYTCECGESYVGDYADATGHADNDGDGYCDGDNELLDPSVECEHSCHKSGLAGFFWKLINFFNKLFKTNQYCECGVAHY